jgi:hypothetical protein
METRAKVRGLLALVCTTNDGKKRTEFVNRDFNAAINIRRCAVLEKRPPDWTSANFAGQSLKVELYEKKGSSSGGRSKKTRTSAHWLMTTSLGRASRYYCTAGVVRISNGVRIDKS